MGVSEIEAFLTHLAVQERVAASIQNQAFSAVPFLYREVWRQELDESINAIRAKQPRQQLPTVLTKAAARSLIQQRLGVPLFISFQFDLPSLPKYSRYPQI
jgi:site-specific recombinase XerD